MRSYNQVMFTIDLRASFFDKGKVFNQDANRRCVSLISDGSLFIDYD